MEKIIIKNFGPIKHVELELKDINIFIGHTSSGKSTVAKLVAISRELLFSISSYENFKKSLVHYNIDFEITNKTFIKYVNEDYHWELKSKKIKDNGEDVVFFRLRNFIEGLTPSIYPDNIFKEENQENKRELIGLFLILGFYKLIPLQNSASEENISERMNFLLKIAEKYREQIDKDNLISEDNIEILNTELRYRRFVKISTSLDIKSSLSRTIYIPAERTLLSMIAESLFGLMNHDVSIAKCIKDFGAQFETARKKLTYFSIPFLNIEYKYSDKSNFITLNDGSRIKLEQASSGLQSVIPLLLVTEANTTEENSFKNHLLIEEPELNLYPTVQKDLVEFIVERINRSDNKLIITTHSPYILTSLDNLIQANNAAKAQPESKEKIAEIVPEEKWVDFDRVACYFFENGTCRSTLDTENQTIAASNIDDVSEDLGKTFDQLLELKYAHVS